MENFDIKNTCKRIAVTQSILNEKKEEFNRMQKRLEYEYNNLVTNFEIEQLTLEEEIKIATTNNCIANLEYAIKNKENCILSCTLSDFDKKMILLNVANDNDIFIVVNNYGERDEYEQLIDEYDLDVFLGVYDKDIFTKDDVVLINDEFLYTDKIENDAIICGFQKSEESLEQLYKDYYNEQNQIYNVIV